MEIAEIALKNLEQVATDYVKMDYDDFVLKTANIKSALIVLAEIQERAEKIRTVCELKIEANKNPRQNEDGSYSYFIHAEAEMHVIDFIMRGKETK